MPRPPAALEAMTLDPVRTQIDQRCNSAPEPRFRVDVGPPRPSRPDSKHALTRAPFHNPHAQRARGPHAHSASRAGPAAGGVRRTLSIPKEFPRLLELDQRLSPSSCWTRRRSRDSYGTEGASEARAFTRDLRLEIESMARANIALAEEAADLRSQISATRAVDMKPVAEASPPPRPRRTRSWASTTSAARCARRRARAGERREERGGAREVAGREIKRCRRVRRRVSASAGKTPRGCRQGVHRRAGVVGRRRRRARRAAAASAGAGVPGEAEVRVRRRRRFAAT